MTASDASLLNSWESMAECGTWLVIIGVAGEGLEIAIKICEHKIKSERFLEWCKSHEFSINMWGGIFWIMVIIGLVMEHKGNNESQLIVKRENARVTQQAGEAIERAGNAEREAQGFRLKADELEAQLRGINPSNVPLASVIAYVAIEYKTNSVQTNEWDFFMQIESNVPPRMTLAIGDRFDQINLIASPLVVGSIDGMYVKRFEWDSTQREFQKLILRNISKSRWPTNELKGNVEDAITEYRIEGLPFLSKTEITGGTVELFFNGTIKREFPIPTQFTGPAPSRNVDSMPSPVTQGRLGATNWWLVDTNGVLLHFPINHGPPWVFKGHTWNF